MSIRAPQNIWRAIRLERDRMTFVIADGISRSFLEADIGCAQQPGEVDRLVYFFLRGLPFIENGFNQILISHGVRSTLSGIFCHQTPRVKPHGESRDEGCELGDIIFIVTYGRRLFRSIIGNALLVQAKEKSNMISDSVQKYLYQTASGYRYLNPRPLRGQERMFQDCQYALWYWIFNNRHPAMLHRRYPTKHISSSTVGLNARRPGNFRRPIPFEIVLMELIMGVNGKRVYFLERDSDAVNWSKIVDDLIRVTARSAFHRQNAYISRSRTPLRGDNAIRTINAELGVPAPFLIRSSFKRIFSIFDKELAQLGTKLEGIGSNFDENVFQKDNPKRFEKKSQGSGKPPILGSERPFGADNDDGGCSFIIMDFSETNNE